MGPSCRSCPLTSVPYTVPHCAPASTVTNPAAASSVAAFMRRRSNDMSLNAVYQPAYECPLHLMVSASERSLAMEMATCTYAGASGWTTHAGREKRKSRLAVAMLSS